MSLTPSNINGMGPVTFPSDGNFGSGDIPMGIPNNIIYTYDSYIKSINKKTDDELDEIEDEINNQFISENSMNDKIKTSGTNKKGMQLTLYVKGQRLSYKQWYDARKVYYREKLKESDHTEEKQLLKNQFKLEIIAKKRDMNDKIKEKRLEVSAKEL